ncbi:SgcJ/EcaC family oxidoreductase [Nesterenkonia salmonea]|uniref:SgcJ/EcaC family oxidoreductase n=1 Tax=Nesterenkonia salmonea TaxID=1804987 RepID=A0A5R9B9Z9_9MICC|nr:SgcJ/EcaC family oxidoreductase [Nesterenkonia salmonea]TLP96348.1 SgcJ/EcaC family oxidoreductase [Nesterenkonia salmonea]
MSDLAPGAQPSRPEEFPDAFAAAWNRKAAESLASLFVEDADFINVVGLWWENQDSIRSAHDYGFRKIFTDSHMSVERVKTRHIAEGVAVIVWEWTLTGQHPPGGQPVGTRQGLFTFVVRQQNEGWLAITAQNTDRISGSETNVSRGGELQPGTYQESISKPRNTQR